MIHISLMYEGRARVFEIRLPSESAAIWYMIYPGSEESFPFDGLTASETFSRLEHLCLKLVEHAALAKRYLNKREQAVYDQTIDAVGMMYFQSGEHPEATWEIIK